MAADRANAAEALLKGGADIEAVDDRRRTALCIAAKYGALDCINVLNEYGANHFHRDEQSLTALETAEQSVRPEAAAQLKRMQQVGLYWNLDVIPPCATIHRVLKSIAGTFEAVGLEIQISLC